MSASAYQVGELVDITINGARVEDDGTDARCLAVVIPGDIGTIDIPLGPAVTVTRVAPPEWPPQTGDVWASTDDTEFMATLADVGRVVLRHAADGASWDHPENVLRAYGPMTLVRRRGWTPTPPAVVEPERAERAELVAGLRELADVLAAHPDLPARHLGVDVCLGPDEGLPALRGWAEALDVEMSDGGLDVDRRRHWRADARLGALAVHVFHVTLPEPESVDPDAWAAQVAQDGRAQSDPAPEPHGAEVPAEARCDDPWHGPFGEPADNCPACGEQSIGAALAELGGESVEDGGEPS